MQKIIRYLTCFLLVCGLLFQSGAWSIEIIIDKGVENPIPIAIVPFSWSQAAGMPPVDIATIINDDLTRSARFSAMEEQHMPQQPHDFNEIQFKDWQRLGMENLVVGQLKQTGTGDYLVEFRLVDVYKGKQIAGFSIPSTQLQLRRTAHEISDIIYEKLIGVRGAFATRIVYITVIKTREGSKKYTLHVSDADGYNPQVLLDSKEPLLSPAWSPDGKKLAYVSFESRNSAVYIQDLLTGARERVASNPGINSAPAWSPDGARLALTLSMGGNPEIYVMHVASKQLRRMTNNAAIDTEPTWSPDGRLLAFTSDRGGVPQIYEIPADGGEPRRLTFDGNYNTRPVYSPDNKHMAVVHGEDGVYRIGLYDRLSKQISILTDSHMDESPSFAPNGHMIIYTTTGARGTALAAISVDGSVHQRLAFQEGEVREPAWGPFTDR
ncbi:MAG: Tol-Pal system beta propeller repeat protein TolB [Gammaproteobacteria bacterium]